MPALPLPSAEGPTSTSSLPTIETVEVFPTAERWSGASSSRHWGYQLAMLLASSGLLLMAGLMQVRTDQQVEFRFFSGRPLPELCQSRLLFGMPCPGCGLTRCFIHAARGDIVAAAQVNPAGLLLVLLVASQIPYRIWRLCSRREILWTTRDLLLLLITPVVLLWITWGVRLVVGE